MLEGGIPFSNPPGVVFEYSNLGFTILGLVVSRVSGMPYRDFVASRILEPLGMPSTTLEAGDVPRERLAHGYRWEDGQWREEPLLPDGAFGPMGGMLASVRDLSRYVAAFLGAWPPRDGAEAPPLRRASLREMQQVWRAGWAAVTTAGSGQPGLRLNVAGYGFGLRAGQTCEFDHLVWHSGGLPGFGSLMRWLPEYGVGFIALGNRTYAGWAGVGDAVFSSLAKTGGLQPRAAQPSPTLAAAKDDVSRLIEAWDDRLVDRIAAPNLFLDRSRERRRAELEALRKSLGACRPDVGFALVENALRGEWTLQCERGRARAAVALAPTQPPAVQYLEVEPLPADGGPPRRSACPK
jgi:CubicO group peptidase (beta-lactamase class C family)